MDHNSSLPVWIAMGALLLLSCSDLSMEDPSSLDLAWADRQGSSGSSSSAAGAGTSSGQSSSSAVSWFNATMQYGLLTDKRDQKEYKTLSIGGQTWMAQNLNYDTLDGDGSGCYEASAGNCGVEGRLYDWATAMGLAGSFDSVQANSAAPHRGICPESWHVPTDGEWKTLEAALGMADDQVELSGVWRGDGEGFALKSLAAWELSAGNTNASGFSALPAGFRAPDGAWDGLGIIGYFWTTAEFYGSAAYFRALSNQGTVFRSYQDKAYSFSLRCVAD